MGYSFGHDYESHGFIKRDLDVSVCSFSHLAIAENFESAKCIIGLDMIENKELIGWLKRAF